MAVRYPSHDSYRKAWKEADTHTPPVPLNVDIELASVCNLTCPFCFISDGSFDQMIRQPSDDGKPRKRLMPTDMAKKIIDECSELGVPALKFNWRGESTLHPDYSEILLYAKRKVSFHDLLVNTNANCKDSAIDGLMAATKVMVSLDSLVPQTYAEMRRGGDLSLAKKVIRELIKRGHQNLWIRRVVTNANESEGFYWDVRRYFGKSVHVSEHFCIDRNEIATYETGECKHDLLPRRYCGYPSQRIVIASTGKCFPCCIDLHESMTVGDFKNESLQEIWAGEKLNALRANLKHDKPMEWSDTCKRCESWMSYDVPKRSYVQDYELTDARPSVIGLLKDSIAV